MSNVTIPEAVGLLDGLTVGEVATVMALSGITGVPSDAHHCVIARWVNRVTGLSVEVDGLAVNERYDREHEPTRWVKLPYPVQTFIENFDGHDYPDLIGPRTA